MRSTAIKMKSDSVTVNAQRKESDQDSDSQFKLIFENATNGIVIARTDGSCIDANPAACELFGLSKKQVVDRKISELIRPSAVSRSRAVWPSDFLQSGEKFESIIICSDAKEQRCECSIKAKVLSSCYLIYLYDITERIRTENAFENQAEILDLANDTIMIRNLEDRIVYWNQGAERLYGWTKREALGAYVHTFLQTTFPKSLPEIFKEFLRTGHWDGQLEHSKKDGTRIIVASRWTLQRGQKGEPSAYLEINNDITDRKRTEVELKKAHDLLEKRVAERTAELNGTNAKLLDQIAEREKTEHALKALSARLISAQEEERRRISRDLHDDLGQILTYISLDLERAVNSAALNKKDALIKRVLKANREARAKLRELSSILRPSVLDDVGLKEAIQTYIAEFSLRTGIETKFVFNVKNYEIPADATTNLYRILQESLTNISKHAKAKNVWIDLHSSNGRVTMLIRDDGIGFRLDSEKINQGLGFAGMRERAELLGGLFKLVSEPGHGTEVAVSFSIGEKVS